MAKKLNSFQKKLHQDALKRARRFDRLYQKGLSYKAIGEKETPPISKQRVHEVLTQFWARQEAANGQQSETAAQPE